MPEPSETYSDRVKRHDRTAKAWAFVSASIRLCADAMRLDPSAEPELQPVVANLMAAKARLSRNVKAIGPV